MDVPSDLIDWKRFSTQNLKYTKYTSRHICGKSVICVSYTASGGTPPYIQTPVGMVEKRVDICGEMRTGIVYIQFNNTHFHDFIKILNTHVRQTLITDFEDDLLFYNHGESDSNGDSPIYSSNLCTNYVKDGANLMYDDSGYPNTREPALFKLNTNVHTVVFKDQEGSETRDIRSVQRGMSVVALISLKFIRVPTATHPYIKPTWDVVQMLCN